MKKLFIIMMFFAAGKAANAAPMHLSSMLLKDTVPISRDTAMKDYVSMQGGQMILVKNDKAGRMSKNMTMKNGTQVMTNGNVKTKDGHTFQLKEGDRVYMNGRIEGSDKTPI